MYKIKRKTSSKIIYATKSITGCTPPTATYRIGMAFWSTSTSYWGGWGTSWARTRPPGRCCGHTTTPSALCTRSCTACSRIRGWTTSPAPASSRTKSTWRLLTPNLFLKRSKYLNIKRSFWNTQQIIKTQCLCKSTINTAACIWRTWVQLICQVARVSCRSMCRARSWWTDTGSILACTSSSRRSILCAPTGTKATSYLGKSAKYVLHLTFVNVLVKILWRINRWSKMSPDCLSLYLTHKTWFVYFFI